MKISEAVARRTKDLIAQKNITQYRLCKDIDMHLNTMTNIMTAKNKSVNLKTILQISKGLGITPSEFLDDPIFTSVELDTE